MRRINKISDFIIYTILFSMILLSITSCDNDTEEIFDKPASERRQDAVEYYKDILISSEYGWALENFVGGSTIAYGGFMNELFFGKENVRVKLDMYDVFAPGYSDSSSYSVIPEGGVVLVFDEYNYVFNYFSTPDSFSPDALEGEIEFQIMSYEDNIIYLKGKKYGVDMRLIKIKDPKYFDNVVKSFKMALNMSTFEFNFVKLTVDKKKVPVGFRSRTLILQERDENGVLKEIVTPFIFNDKGMRFYKPVTINGVTFQELYANYEEEWYSSKDGKVVLYTTNKLPFDIKNTTWIINPNTTECSDLFTTTFNEIDKKNSSIYPEEKLLNKIKLGYAKVDNVAIQGITFASAYISNPDSGHIISFEIQAEENVENELIIKLTGDGYKIQDYQHLKPLVELIVNNSPYNYEMDDETNPSVIKLISKTNPKVWFIINK